jgi:hypothetical protein
MGKPSTVTAKTKILFVPPPWLWGEDPRYINFENDASIFNVLLNYVLFFGAVNIAVAKKNQEGDLNENSLYPLPGFFCLRSPKGVFYLDFIPGFSLARVNDFINSTSDSIQENQEIELGYCVHRDAVVPKKFVAIRNKLSKMMNGFRNYVCSYRRIFSKSNG